MALVIVGALSTAGRCEEAVADDAADFTATHEQTATIKVAAEDKPLPLQTFCLDAAGNILAGLGNGEGEIRVLDADGEFLRSWKTPVTPEALNVAPDGAVLVAGGGKLLKYDREGRLLLEKESPHAASIKENAAKIREDVINQFKQRSQVYAQQIELYEAEIKKLKANGELSDLDQRRVAAYERNIEALRRYVAQNADNQPSDEQIEQQVAAMSAYKLKFSSISASGNDVFVAVPAMVGYGYDIWRMSDTLDDAKNIVTGLRGCCGQMDVQCNADGVFVAENSRHRVCRYDRDGELITTWGQRATEGVVGFGSCCNPMNVAFGPGGDVYTAESTTGRIKRYSPSGELLGLVGNVDLVPGCKKVSIAVSRDVSRVYMLDMTRTHIVLMTRKANKEAAQ
jgi:hypothetical protein